MAAMTFAVRSPSGARHRLAGLTAASTVGELKEKVRQLVSLAPSAQVCLKSGFPPAALCASDSTNLSETALRSGDQLLVETGATTTVGDVIGGAALTGGHAQASRPAGSVSTTPQPAQPQKKALERYSVPADNSCLFASLLYCMGKGVTAETVGGLRQVAASRVVQEPDNFNAAILGKPPQEYANWILDGDHWGGAIELNILCRHFQVQIAVADIQSRRLEEFGAEFAFESRVFLAYDGIHYDPLHMVGGELAMPRTLFDSEDVEAVALAMEFAETAHSQRQFVDMKRFTVRCLVCQQGFAGDAEVVKHAKQTGHANFGEYKA